MSHRLTFFAAFVFMALYISIDILVNFVPLSREMIYVGIYGFSFICCSILWWIGPINWGSILFSRTPLPVWLLILLMAWSGFSILWLEPQYQSTACMVLMHEVGKASVIYFVGMYGDIANMFRGGVLGYAVGSLVSILYLLSTINISSVLRLGSEGIINPNDLGMIMTFSILVCIYLFLQTRQVGYRLLIGMAFIIFLSGLIMSFSKTAIASMALCSLVFLILKGVKLRNLLIFIAILILDAAFFFDRIKANIMNVKHFETLTHRTEVWDYTLQMIKANPIWGYGFKSFQSAGPFNFITAHNDYLSRWFEGGIVAVVLLISIYLAYLALSIKVYKTPGLKIHGSFALSMLLFFSLRGFMEGSHILIFYPPILTMTSLGLYFMWRKAVMSQLYQSVVLMNHKVGFESSNPVTS